MFAVPDIIACAATDLAAVGSALAGAHASAAAPTVGILAAAQDEVSSAIAAVFSSYAVEYQRINQDAAAYHAKFVRALDTAASAYAGAEAANASALSDLTLAGVFNSLIYQPTYTIGQAWITSRVGEFVDATFINPIGQLLIGRDLLGNGAPGVSGGTVLQAAGGPGGLLFGNGGPGGTAASGQGGLGGAAGL
ncbi:PE family protein, partial [Mycobacterium conspicuum]